ncbi:MAG: glycoside hydrolase family protein [Thalassotalea sp.]
MINLLRKAALVSLLAVSFNGITQAQGEVNFTVSSAGTSVKESDFSKALQQGTRILAQENWNVWGTSPIIGDDGKIHVFYSRWRGTHGRWLSHSEIAHAVADKPEGPYTVLGTVLSGRGEGHWDADTIHNPTIQKVGDKYALFFIGNNLADAKKYDGHHASTQRIGLALSDSLYGPFKRVSDAPILDVSKDHTKWDSYLTTNPALLLHPNGEYWLYYKAWDRYNDDMRKMGVAIAKDITGPYIKHEKNPLVSFADIGKQVEDAYVYFYQNKYHMIMRDMGVIHPHVGLMLDSPDGLTWSAAQLGYRTNTQYLDEEKVERMERPQVLMVEGKPKYLFLALMGGKYKTSTGFVLDIAEH